MQAGDARLGEGMDRQLVGDVEALGLGVDRCFDALHHLRRDVEAGNLARDEPHPINAPFTIERFRDGYLIDEAAAAAVAH